MLFVWLNQIIFKSSAFPILGSWREFFMWVHKLATFKTFMLISKITNSVYGSRLWAMTIKKAENTT